MNQEELDALLKAELGEGNAKKSKKSKKSKKEEGVEELSEDLGEGSEGTEQALEEIENTEQALEEIEELPEEIKEELKDAKEAEEEIKEKEEESKESSKSKDKEVSLNLPVDNQHKVIFQLDEVAKDSEIHANEVFTELEGIQESNMALLDGLKSISQYANSQKEIFEKLSSKFPNIQIFSSALEETQQNLALIKSLEDKINDCDMSINNAMNAMQFQDIYQQKINRIIHIIQSLVQYVNSLFESKEVGRSAPARHIVGDDTKDTFSQDEIEKLINSFGKNP
ncbi:hypothetical protein [Helicobacter mustelae]|uniref:Chemotaxis protein n=1 Tax=Helicobacter mustelae (strain ATCC 43772 / CCUG 25715 / CIP 103759 / LMG 18044 / NCTC 12198 / R85-136P) TaxID=679897 RepID=D3UGA5_HELM1|nr:hypothetical protein [Helicobacter mustelae]CBG39526.1 putative hypothetical protein [Helicobacter mustelae 12198]SQH71037.1 Uncharacterised protein [Helicobacter mustelae]